MPEGISDAEWQQHVAAERAAGRLPPAPPGMETPFTGWQGGWGLGGQRVLLPGHPNYIKGSAPSFVEAQYEKNMADAAAGNVPAPLPEPTLIPQGNPNAPGTITSGMGSDLRLKSIGELGADALRAATPGLTRVGGIPRSDDRLSDEGLRQLYAGADYQAAARRAEAKIKAGEEVELGNISDERAAMYKEDAASEETRLKNTAAEVKKIRERQEADTEYIRTHSRIDPYRTFRTNAGAGVMALLGTALMAGGASMRRDGTLEWTKQIDKLLEREAEEQIQLLNNKKWAVTEAGQNLKRIMDTSKDAYEAKVRVQMQWLNAASERAAAIAHRTESEAVKQRAEALIAENEQKNAQHVMDLAIRQQGLRSQEEIAALGARSQARSSDLSFIAAMAGHETQAQVALANAARALNAPKNEAELAVHKAHGAAAAALDNYLRVLKDPEASADAKNQAASFAADAVAQYNTGAAASPEARNSSRSFGVPLLPRDWKRKIDAQSEHDIRATREALDRSMIDRVSEIRTGTYTGSAPPPGSSITLKKR